MLCKIKKVLPWIAVIGWMTVIFCLSHQSSVESAEISTGLLDKIFELFGEIIDHNTLRKLAHAFEYFVLCVFTFNAFNQTVTKEKIKTSALSLLTCLIYAISDEIHQIFIPGRAGRVSDVFIDMSGAVSGLIFCIVILFVYNKLKHKEVSEK